MQVIVDTTIASVRSKNWACVVSAIDRAYVDSNVCPMAIFDEVHYVPS